LSPFSNDPWSGKLNKSGRQPVPGRAGEMQNGHASDPPPRQDADERFGDTAVGDLLLHAQDPQK